MADRRSKIWDSKTGFRAANLIMDEMGTPGEDTTGERFQAKPRLIKVIKTKVNRSKPD